MASYYASPNDPDSVHVFEFQRDDDAPFEVRCNVCKGSGLEYIQGQETDCMTCEGWGSILT